MKNTLHYAVGGAIAAAMVALLRLVLTQQAALARLHYPAFDLAGLDGLAALGRLVLFGAGYGVAYGLLLKSLLPGGLILGPLSLGLVPTLVDALVLPLRRGAPAIRDPWTLAWLFAHWVFYALCLIFIVGSKGSGGKRREED